MTQIFVQESSNLKAHISRASYSGLPEHPAGFPSFLKIQILVPGFSDEENWLSFVHIGRFFCPISNLVKPGSVGSNSVRSSVLENELEVRKVHSSV